MAAFMTGEMRGLTEAKVTITFTNHLKKLVTVTTGADKVKIDAGKTASVKLITKDSPISDNGIVVVTTEDGRNNLSQEIFRTSLQVNPTTLDKEGKVKQPFILKNKIVLEQGDSSPAPRETTITTTKK